MHLAEREAPDAARRGWAFGQHSRVRRQRGWPLRRGALRRCRHWHAAKVAQGLGAIGLVPIRAAWQLGHLGDGREAMGHAAKHLVGCPTKDLFWQ